MTEDAVLQLLHRKQILVTSMPASMEGKRAFLGVYPIEPTWPSTRARLRRFGISLQDTAAPLYRISSFEIDQKLVETQDYPSEDDLDRVRDVVAIGDDDLRSKLLEFGVDLTQLDLPSNSDYPL